MAVLLVTVLVSLWAAPIARAEQRMRVALDMRNTVVTPPTVLAAALREATAIWAPYGVTIEKGARPRGALDENGVMLVPVTFESARARGHRPHPRSPLGWTGFTRTGQPTMQIAVFYDTVVAAASGGFLFGVRDMQASILQDRLMARVLGRTLAHELGHVLLRTPDHASSGLMRAAQSVSELQHPSRAGFTLDQEDIARLQRVRDGSARATMAAQQ